MLSEVDVHSEDVEGAGPGTGVDAEPATSPIPILGGEGGDGSGLTSEALVRPRVQRPRSGWRGLTYSATAGVINPGVGEAESRRQDLLGRIGRRLSGSHRIAVSSLKGGVGKTTVAAVLGLTLAEHRGDRVVAIDADPDAGTLADRLSGQSSVTVRQMLDNIDSIDSVTAMSRYTSMAGRLSVLASEQDPAMSEAFSREEYTQVCDVLGGFFNVIITDSGTGLVHSAMKATLTLADSLIVVGTPTVDGASRAAKTLEWLIARGHRDLVADSVLVLCGDRASPEVDLGRVREHFARRCRATVEIPSDPHLTAGGRLDRTLLRDPTRMAFLQLGALMADRFAT
jgi:MinD-like ATPase involved in chromosome partitioning or flagellar assembly